MKTAVVIARVSSGWKLVAAGEHVGEIKENFKQVKGDGYLKVGKEFADRILYFDTGGNMRRVSLSTPKSIEQIEKLNAAEADKRAEQASREADAVAAREGQAKAAEVAGRVVEVVRQELAAGSGQPTPPAAAPVVVPPVESASSAASEPRSLGADETGSDDPQNHFGGSR